MRFSVIVATLNREAELSRLLETLRHQTFRDFEVIVVDQNDHDRVEAIAASYQHSLKLQYLRTRPGVSHARNRGVEVASGDLVAFPDDDCWYAPTLLERVNATFETLQCDMIVGSYSEEGKLNPQFPEAPCRLTQWRLLKRMSAVTTFARMAIFREGLVFREDLGPGTSLPSAEELDWGIRTLHRGYKGAYRPDLLVYHLIHRESTVSLQARRNRERANAYVLAYHARYSARVFAGYLAYKSAKLAVQALHQPDARTLFRELEAGVRQALSPSRA